MMRKWMLMIAAIKMSASANAADWLYAGKADDGDRAYVDVSNMGTGANVLRFWVKWEKSTDQSDPAHLGMQIMEVKCDIHQIRTIESVEYGRSGVVLQSYHDDYAPFESVIPESMGEEIEAAACLNDTLVHQENMRLDSIPKQ